MKKLLLAAVIGILGLVLSTHAALAGSKAGKMFVVIDRGIEKSMNDGEIKNLNQLGAWMDEDLVKLLKKAGFDAELVNSESDFKAVDGSYLLSVKIKDYNPGSRAARMIVGFGAGSTSMKTHYELRGSGSSPIAEDDLAVGSGRDWRNVVRKIDEQTVDAVKKKLQ